MKALHFFDHGSISNLHFGDLPTPKPGAGEVLIKVKACSINHLDLWVLRGWPGLKLARPHIGGADISGEVAELGEGVTGHKAGDAVIVTPGFTLSEDRYTERDEDSLSPGYKIIGEQLKGGFAEYVVVPAKAVFEKPKALSFEDACAPLLVGLTAWRMLVRRAQLKAGDRVLVVGAGGGVNSISIQIAAALGAQVIALSSTDEKCAQAIAMGAKEVINYKKVPDWSREVRRLTEGQGVDVVIDNVGTQTFPQSINSCARGGRIVTVGNTSGALVEFDNRLIFTKQLSILGSTMGSRQDFIDMLGFLQEKKIKVHIDTVFSLKDGKEAYRTLEEGRQFGKVLVVPN
jgi:NADPH:quinone reductase-like Zn-dependent oxidoreductase